MFSFFSKAGVVERLLKTAPYISIALVITSIGYFGWMYLITLRESAKATKDQVVELQKQNLAILDVNKEISATMKGVKDLTENYQNKVITIRSNTHTITNTIKSPEFKESSLLEPSKAQETLNESFNQVFQSINEESK